MAHKRFLIMAFLFGCEATSPSSARPIHAPPLQQHSRAAATSAQPQQFGNPLDATIAVTPLSELVNDAERFEGKTIRTEGQIARVCQSMGCWMELRADENSPSVRVPMAGHAFFVPKESINRHASIQGRIAFRPLTAAMKAHLQSEGAAATESKLAIEATGVVID